MKAGAGVFLFGIILLTAGCATTRTGGNYIYVSTTPANYQEENLVLPAYSDDKNPVIQEDIDEVHALNPSDNKIYQSIDVIYNGS